MSDSTRANAAPGQLPDPSALVDVSKLIAAYYEAKPDPSVAAERVIFGTSGHRGTAFQRTFNEWHILATSQAICDYRRAQAIDGPLFIGRDTHALSKPAFESALEVLAANRVDAMVSAGDDEYTPTPVVSHAILTYNERRTRGRADGIVVTPSHNPPEDGGFKYNPPDGGPADEQATSWIEARANELLAAKLAGVERVPLAQALRAPTTHLHDYRSAYIADLGDVLDMEVIAGSGVHLGVDPLGGAGVHYWAPIAERYKLDLAVVNDRVDPQFAFMTLDWDGRIRMDPSSPSAMRGLIGLKDRFDVAFACDPDHDRHGVVTRSAGLLPPNHYLCACIEYLFSQRARWSRATAIGKTIVSSSLIDRLAAARGRRLFEVPVGFKWFVPGLLSGALGFVGEESAGATFLRRGGRAWTTDKDGIAAALLAAEIMARTGRDPGELYHALTGELGNPVYARTDVPATADDKQALRVLSAADVPSAELAGEPIQQVLTAAPGNGHPVGGLKIVAANGWFAARPSGTEAVYKVYAESFRGASHLERIQADARAIVAAALRRGRPDAAPRG